MDVNEMGINALRFLAVDTVNKANSGHPGICLGAAAIMHTLYTRFLRATPVEPNWIGRDRFVLAAGHGSALLYSILHIAGYDVTTFDLMNFRQLNSKTPGHPEVTHTPGIDCTSGPLGQGIAHAVGLAMAETRMAELFNKEDITLFDNHTYVLCGDGDMEEGVTQEAISLAGNLHLNKLIVLYDSNNITLDGDLRLSFTEDVEKRFKACNWNVLKADGMSVESVEKALKKATKSTSAPTLIICNTIIGFGSKNAATCLVHGSPIGEEDTASMRKEMGWNYQPFVVPNEVYDYYQATFQRRGLKAAKSFANRLKKYKKLYPEDYKLLTSAFNGDIYKDIKYPEYEIGSKEATRVSSGKILNAIAPQLPTLFGGASDVARSVNTEIKNEGIYGFDKGGRNIYFGIREFAMSCAQTGILLYGGLRPYLGCFLVFCDYMKASIRTAALMNVPSINLFTHDSIAVGEDGPTHQPIEQISTLRLIPNTVTFRPAGGKETVWSYKYALENRNRPVNLILSRQNIDVRNEVSYDEFKKGAYVVRNATNPDKIIVATGSELPLALDVAEAMEEKGVRIKVVSMPSMELFDRQSKTYKKEVFNIKRDNIIAIEMGSTGLWYKYASEVIGIDNFGKSAKSSDVIADYGFSVEAICQKLFG